MELTLRTELKNPAPAEKIVLILILKSTDDGLDVDCR